MSDPKDFDYTEYPKRFIQRGEEFFLVRESQWIRRFESKKGNWSVFSRLLDGSFDEELLGRLKVEEMSGREKDDAALALKVSGRKDLPKQWEDLVNDTEIFSV